MMDRVVCPLSTTSEYTPRPGEPILSPRVSCPGERVSLPLPPNRSLSTFDTFISPLTLTTTFTNHSLLQRTKRTRIVHPTPHLHHHHHLPQARTDPSKPRQTNSSTSSRNFQATSLRKRLPPTPRPSHSSLHSLHPRTPLLLHRLPPLLFFHPNPIHLTPRLQFNHGTLPFIQKSHNRFLLITQDKSAFSFTRTSSLSINTLLGLYGSTIDEEALIFIPSTFEIHNGRRTPLVREVRFKGRIIRRK
jgi:hypothetical protein